MIASACRVLLAVLLSIACCLVSGPARAQDPVERINANYVVKGRPRFSDSGSNYRVALAVGVRPDHVIEQPHTWRVAVHAAGVDKEELSECDVQSILAMSSVGGSGELMAGRSAWGPASMVTYVSKSAKYLAVVVSVIELDGMDPSSEVCEDLYAATFPNGVSVGDLQPIEPYREECTRAKRGYRVSPSDDRIDPQQDTGRGSILANVRMFGRPRFESQAGKVHAVIDSGHAITIEGTKKAGSCVEVMLFGASVDASWSPSPRALVFCCNSSDPVCKGNPHHIGSELGKANQTTPTEFKATFSMGDQICTAGHVEFCLVAFIRETTVNSTPQKVEDTASAVWIPITLSSPSH